MVDLTAWYDQGQDEPELLSTPEDLDRVLDVLAGRDGRLLVELDLADELIAPRLTVGVNARDRVGSLCYSANREAWFSTNAPESPQRPEDHVLYYYMMSDTEYPADCEIPLDVVRRAAHEYMRTGGQRPAEPQWRDALAWLL